MREKIHFVHGNGFPAACYNQLFVALNPYYECSYINKIGHDPRFPVTDNWEYLVDELLTSIREKFSEPIIGLGHSFGGVLNFLAALKAPSLFKAIILIDSPLLGRFKSLMIRIAKSLKMIDKITPAARTVNRRHYWQTKEQLITYLRSRPLFKTFKEECLQDYIHFGFKKTTEGYYLLFDKQVEYNIFRTLPHHLPNYEGQLVVPTALIYGEQSDVVHPFDARYMKKKYRINGYPLKGTHMLPMEDPTGVAEEICKALTHLHLRRKQCC